MLEFSTVSEAVADQNGELNSIANCCALYARLTQPVRTVPVYYLSLLLLQRPEMSNGLVFMTLSNITLLNACHFYKVLALSILTNFRRFTFQVINNNNEVLTTAERIYRCYENFWNLFAKWIMYNRRKYQQDFFYFW